MSLLSWFGLLAGTVLTALLLAVGHWFPWLDRERKLRNYSYGTVCLILGFAVWRILVGDVLSVLGLVVIALIGGAVVALAYWMDDVVRSQRQARMAEEADDDIPEM